MYLTPQWRKGQETGRTRKYTLSSPKTWQHSLRAVAFNLNAHFLFYFQILTGILGMLRRAGYKARSTRWSRMAATRHVLMETNHLSVSSLQTFEQKDKGLGEKSVGLTWLDATSQPCMGCLFNAKEGCNSEDTQSYESARCVFLNK